MSVWRVSKPRFSNKRPLTKKKSSCSIKNSSPPAKKTSNSFAPRSSSSNPKWKPPALASLSPKSSSYALARREGARPRKQKLRPYIAKIHSKLLIRWCLEGDRLGLDALHGFRVLGPTAAPALPELARMIRDNSRRGPNRDLPTDALTCIGKEAFPTLVAALSARLRSLPPLRRNSARASPRRRAPSSKLPQMRHPPPQPRIMGAIFQATEHHMIWSEAPALWHPFQIHKTNQTFTHHTP